MDRCEVTRATSWIIATKNATKKTRVERLGTRLDCREVSLFKIEKIGGIMTLRLHKIKVMQERNRLQRLAYASSNERLFSRSVRHYTIICVPISQISPRNFARLIFPQLACARSLEGSNRSDDNPKLARTSSSSPEVSPRIFERDQLKRMIRLEKRN